MNPGGLTPDSVVDLGPDIACRDTDGEKFFMRDGERTEAAEFRMRPVAQAYCAGCLVRPACASIGALERFRFGLWGGVLYRGSLRPIDLLAVAR